MFTHQRVTVVFPEANSIPERVQFFPQLEKMDIEGLMDHRKLSPNLLANFIGRNSIRSRIEKARQDLELLACEFRDNAVLVMDGERFGIASKHVLQKLTQFVL